MAVRFTRSQTLLPGLLLLALLLVGCGGQVSALKTLPLARIIRSAGCGKNAPFPAGTSQDEELREANQDRLFRLHIPTGYHSGTPYPLIFNFHGHGGNMAAQERMTGFSHLADLAGFIVAYPQGSIGPDGHTGWNTGPRNYPQADDLRFTADIARQIQKQLCVDTRRIYATGFSNGGALTDILACKMAETFAAVAIVSGGLHPIKGGCHPARAIALLEIHGTADQTVPYGGNAENDFEPPVSQTLATWARLDGCASQPERSSSQAGVLLERWTRCQASTSVVHYRLAGGVHAWPAPGNGPGIDGHSIDATTLIWHFLQTYTLPETVHV